MEISTQAGATEQFTSTHRRVVILGGTGGVGEGIVRAHLAAGADVIVPTRNESKGARLRELVCDELAGRLSIVVGDYSTFDGAHDVAETIVTTYGDIDDVIASIGGWWMGKPIWAIDEADWRRAFTGLATAHVAAVRAFLPRLRERGSYTLILGGSATTPVPGSGIVSMEQAALLMMRSVLTVEAGAQRRIHSLVLGPVQTRTRHQVDPTWVSADEVGMVSVALAGNLSASGGDIELRSSADVQTVLRSLEDSKEQE